MSRSSRWTIPGRAGIADVGELRVARQEAVHQRAVGVTGAGMHHQPRGLGHHRDVGVLVPHDDRRPSDRVAGARAPPAPPAPRSRSPASSRRLLATRSPSTSTEPASTSACTSLRVQPVSSATARSTRSPASASGTASSLSHRRQLIASARVARCRSVRTAQMHDEDRADGDRGVGDVERREAADVHEVDDRTAAGSRATGTGGRRGSRARPRAPTRARRPSAGRRCGAPPAREAPPRRWRRRRATA